MLKVQNVSLLFYYFQTVNYLTMLTSLLHQGTAMELLVRMVPENQHS